MRGREISLLLFPLGNSPFRPDMIATFEFMTTDDALLRACGTAAAAADVLRVKRSPINLKKQFKSCDRDESSQTSIRRFLAATWRDWPVVSPGL